MQKVAIWLVRARESPQNEVTNTVGNLAVGLAIKLLVLVAVATIATIVTVVIVTLFVVTISLVYLFPFVVCGFPFSRGQTGQIRVVVGAASVAAWAFASFNETLTIRHVSLVVERLWLRWGGNGSDYGGSDSSFAGLL